jgi:hypothetical protein
MKNYLNMYLVTNSGYINDNILSLNILYFNEYKI